MYMSHKLLWNLSTIQTIKIFQTVFLGSIAALARQGSMVYVSTGYDHKPCKTVSGV